MSDHDWDVKRSMCRNCGLTALQARQLPSMPACSSSFPYTGPHPEPGAEWMAREIREREHDAKATR